MKDKIMIFIIFSYILFFSIFHLILKDEAISYSERRKLTEVPSFSLSSDYIQKVDKYLLDHFPFRDNFKSLKATFNYQVLKKSDNNGVFLKDNYIFKANYPTNEKSIKNFQTKIRKIESLLSQDNKIYLMIVPDKNYYLQDDEFLKLDYDYLYTELARLDIENIDLRNILELSDYYETDTHFKQEKLDKVVYEMAKVMKFPYQEIKYDKHIYPNFYGVYYGDSLIKRDGEALTYLTNQTLDNVLVNYLENKSLKKIYNFEKLDSFDPYEVYLDGASSFISIINNESLTDKELVIFRDSFASSLAPLLIPFYEKITLIDNRYITSENFKDLIEFKDQDVLFMYSTLIVNNSFSLKG